MLSLVSVQLEEEIAQVGIDQGDNWVCIHIVAVERGIDQEGTD